VQYQEEHKVASGYSSKGNIWLIKCIDMKIKQNNRANCWTRQTPTKPEVRTGAPEGQAYPVQLWEYLNS